MYIKTTTACRQGKVKQVYIKTQMGYLGALIKLLKASVQSILLSTKLTSTSSRCNIYCSRHEIAETVLTWR